MAEVYEVSNMQDAIALAMQFKKSKRYNLFRGQAEDWPIIPSAYRLRENIFEKEKKKLYALYDFFKTNHSALKYSANVEWLLAVAQHYGLPTNLIDFSSSVEVAVYFATNSSNVPAAKCVIICLNEKKFNDFIKLNYPNLGSHPPSIVKIDVDNLWRLQSQNGCFVSTHIVNIEDIYPFDKIYFPFEEPYSSTKTKEIYPKRKSELEILLDHFFNAQKRFEGARNFKKILKKRMTPGTNLTFPDAKQFLKIVQVHASWNSVELMNWEFPLKERWVSSRLETINILLKILDSSNLQIENVTEQLKNYFSLRKVSRSSAIEFEVKTDLKLQNDKLFFINRSCARIWDGMRNLPYTDLDIIGVIAKYIYLESQYQYYEKMIHLTDKEYNLLELTNQYGSITRAWASSEIIKFALRNDLIDILNDEMKNKIGVEILMFINIPFLVFDFFKLVKLFADELICYQVLLNSEDENPVIFFTPSQISILGFA